ncbi:MAG: SGNH hydrolase domain-containing protein [Rhodanobacter sp.]
MVLANVFAFHWYSRAADQMQNPDQQRYARARVDAPAIYGMGCDDWYHSDRVQVCTFGSKDATHTAVLMGDSIAGQWFPTVAKAFDRPGWRLLVMTKSACPMVNQPFFYGRIGREYTECSTWRKHVLDQLAVIKPDVVLLSSAPTYDFTQAQWVDGATDVLKAVSASSTHIYVLRGTPHLPFDGPDCLAEHNGRPNWFGLQRSCRALSDDEHTDQVYAWLQQAGSRFQNVKTLDMNDLICPQGECDAERQGLVVFRDSQHMTATFAASLGSALQSRMSLNALSVDSHAAEGTFRNSN